MQTVDIITPAARAIEVAALAAPAAAAAVFAHWLSSPAAPLETDAAALALLLELAAAEAAAELDPAAAEAAAKAA